MSLNGSLKTQSLFLQWQVKRLLVFLTVSDGNTEYMYSYNVRTKKSIAGFVCVHISFIFAMNN